MVAEFVELVFRLKTASGCDNFARLSLRFFGAIKINPEPPAGKYSLLQECIGRLDDTGRLAHPAGSAYHMNTAAAQRFFQPPHFISAVDVMGGTKAMQQGIRPSRGRAALP